MMFGRKPILLEKYYNLIIWTFFIKNERNAFEISLQSKAYKNKNNNIFFVSSQKNVFLKFQPRNCEIAYSGSTKMVCRSTLFQYNFFLDGIEKIGHAFWPKICYNSQWRATWEKFMEVFLRQITILKYSNSNKNNAEVNDSWNEKRTHVDTPGPIEIKISKSTQFSA